MLVMISHSSSGGSLVFPGSQIEKPAVCKESKYVDDTFPRAWYKLPGKTLTCRLLAFCSGTCIEMQDDAWAARPQCLTSPRNANSNLTLSIPHVTQTARAHPTPYPIQLLTPPETASIRCERLVSHIKISVVLLLEMLHFFSPLSPSSCANNSGSMSSSVLY